MRLFIGIALSSDVRAQLKREADDLRTYMRGNFSLESNYHVTLAFLGQHEEDELPRIRAAQDAAVARQSPFDIRIGDIGAFKKGNRQIVWAGVKPCERLMTLHSSLCCELRARNIAFSDEGVYRPHITLARQCDIVPLPAGAVRSIQHVGEIMLFESARRDGILRYTPLNRARLMR